MGQIVITQIDNLVQQSFAGRVTYENLQAFLENPDGYTGMNTEMVNSANTGKVKELSDSIAESTFPTEMTIGGRTYDILGFLREGETSVAGHEMVTRAKAMSVHLGQDDGQHILEHQDQIPASLRGKMIFVFTDWCHPDSSEEVGRIYWRMCSRQWVQGWAWFDDHWLGHFRMLRRK